MSSRRRFGALVGLMVAAMLAATCWSRAPAASTKVGLLVVTRSSNPAVASTVAAVKAHLKALRTQAGYRKEQLPLVEYDFDRAAERDFCTRSLGIRAEHLAFVGVVRLTGAREDLLEGAVLFRVNGVRDASTAAETAFADAQRRMGAAVAKKHPSATTPSSGPPVPSSTNAQGYLEGVNQKDGSVLIRIPSGTFTMGSNDGDVGERPAHSVSLSSYWIGKVPVTNAQFRRFVDATVYKGAGTDSGSWRKYASEWGDDCPVVDVSWNDARAYCTWAGLRLPTEAEWEFAARGPGNRTYPWGDTWNPDLVVWSGNSGRRARPVGSKANASWCGALDMAGNVWQWTSSWYDRYPGSTNSDSLFGQNCRVLRGGSWNYIDAAYFRGADRNWYNPDDRGNIIGFRVARNL